MSTRTTGVYIAALFPERAAAARILLKGILAAYDAFFALSWSEQPVTGVGIPLDIGPIKSWAKTVSWFTKRVLPEVKNQTSCAIKSGQVVSQLQDVFDASTTVAWLTSKHIDAREILNDFEISSLVEFSRLFDIGRSKTVRHETGRYRLWDGANEMDVLYVAMARRPEQILSEAFPEGVPDKSEQQRWLHFAGHAASLAIRLHELKVASFKAQPVRQIVNSNPL